MLLHDSCLMLTCMGERKRRAIEIKKINKRDIIYIHDIQMSWFWWQIKKEIKERKWSENEIKDKSANIINLSKTIILFEECVMYNTTIYLCYMCCLQHGVRSIQLFHLLWLICLILWFPYGYDCLLWIYCFYSRTRSS